MLEVLLVWAPLLLVRVLDLVQEKRKVTESDILMDLDKVTVQ